MIMMPYAWTLDIAAAHRSGRLLAPHRLIWRRKTAFSCRSTKSSASLDTWCRVSTVRKLSRQRTSR